MNIHDEKFHSHMEGEHEKELERIALVDEVGEREREATGWAPLDENTILPMFSVLKSVRPISSRETFLDNQIEEAERISNAPCTCSYEDVKDGTRCEACSERGNG